MLYFYKLYHELMYQNCMRSSGGSYVQSYHLVRRLETIMRKICTCHVKKNSIKKLLGKFMRKSYKYRKSYAEKFLSNSYVEKYHPIVV